MSNEQINHLNHHFQFIRQRLTNLPEESAADQLAIDAALENLQVTYEQMQTNLQLVQVVYEELFQQKQYYQNLFQGFPIAALVTDPNGVVLEPNQAIAQLLNVSHSYLVNRPLAVFVAEDDRRSFRFHLIQLSQSTGIQTWQTRLCPRDGEPVLTQLQVAIVRNTNGQIEHLKIGVYSLSQLQEAIPSAAGRPPIASQFSEVIASSQQLDNVLTEQPMSQLPQSLDGLRVLVVDDEADIREFITAVLEAHGIGVRTVTNAAAALEELDRFRPNVLLSDIRMSGEDGYSLIRQIRALEAVQGGHLPAVAMTAYLDEDRDKVLRAGFEAHLYKMVQPSEWVEMVAQFAR